jgi:dGTPase
VTDLVTATHQRLRQQRQIGGGRAALPYNVIGFSEDMHRRNRQLRLSLYNNLYRHHRGAHGGQAERIISDLFNAYRAEPAMPPLHIQGIIEDAPETHDLRLYRWDDGRFAVEHQKLFDPTFKP